MRLPIIVDDKHASLYLKRHCFHVSSCLSKKYYLQNAQTLSYKCL